MVLSAMDGGEGRSPFDGKEGSVYYERSYAYLLEEFRKTGLSCGFCSSKDVLGSDSFRSYWSYENGGWIKEVKEVKARCVFTRSVPRNKEQAVRNKSLYEGEAIVFPFNDLDMFLVMQDKLRTYKRFSDWAIPTVKVLELSEDSVKKSILELKEILREPLSDFVNEVYVLKDIVSAKQIHLFSQIEINPLKTLFHISNSDRF